MTTTKANDVLELGTARALLGCSSSMSLLDGVRAIKSELHDAFLRIEELEKQHARSTDDKGSDRSAEAVGEEHRPQEPASDDR